MTYYRLDEGLSPPQLVERIKANLAAGLPSMFGFTVYSSLSQGGSGGEIPFPAPPESVRGGHAVVAVGYDDGKTIKNPNAGGPKTKGAFLIRNSWGSSWGDGGYGWLPYEYTLRGLAVDWWSLVKNEYVATQRFGI